jgi:CRP-like cAMP-binding protein
MHSQDCDRADSPASSLKFRKGETVDCQGDAAERWFEVKVGVVQTSQSHVDGRRQVTSFCYPGDVFGVEAGLRRDAAEALTDVELLCWRSGQVPGTAQGSERTLRKALDAAHRSIGLFGHRTAEERLAAFLIGLSERTSSPILLHLPMLRSDIADYLGLSLHTVSRTISDLARRGLIALQGSQYVQILKPQVLRQALDKHA